jgi:hypothetical protein
MIEQMVFGKVNGRTQIDCVPDIDSLSTRAQDVLMKVRVLREYTQRTGFKTTKSQNNLIQSLNGDDLASALLVLKHRNSIPSPSVIDAISRRV